MSVATTTRERPILFSGEMVRAILEGRKTQTRRVVKDVEDNTDVVRVIDPDAGPFWRFSLSSGGATQCHELDCPYGKPGDRLWVRETWVSGHPVIGGDIHSCDEFGNDLPEKVWYRADNEPFCWTDDDGARTDRIPWRPSIHMPRRFSRITLDILAVRVERLQDISCRDAEAEGAACRTDLCWEGTTDDPDFYGKGFVAGFADLWRRINGPESWDANPWVWVVEFRKVERDYRELEGEG